MSVKQLSARQIHNLEESFLNNDMDAVLHVMFLSAKERRTGTLTQWSKTLFRK
ncbi:hypothetical protein ACFSYB_10635 [Litchfieldia salsa]